MNDSCLSRRQWLALAGGALSACSPMPNTEPADSPEAADPLDGRIIDAHVHVWTPDTAAYPLADGFTPDRMKPPSFTPEELFALCRPVGVGRINLIQMSFYGDDHRYMLDAMEGRRDVFAGTGLLTDAASGKSKPVERMLDLAERGVKAFRLRGRARANPDTPRWMDRPNYEALYRAAAERKLALSFLADPEDLSEIDRMGQRFPETPVIVDHLARIRPAQEGAEQHIEALCRLARHPRTLIKVGAFYALSEQGPPYADLLPLIGRVVDAFGPERCMWESDSPFQAQPPHAYAASLALIRDHADFLSASDKEHLLFRTAERFFFVD